MLERRRRAYNGAVVQKTVSVDPSAIEKVGERACHGRRPSGLGDGWRSETVVEDVEELAHSAVAVHRMTQGQVAMEQVPIAPADPGSR